MPVNTGAAFIFTLLPAVIFFTMNYIEGGTDSTNNKNDTKSEDSGIRHSSYILNASDNLIDQVIESDFIEQVRNSSVVKKSVGVRGGKSSSVNNLNIDFNGPVLPTCCDISVKSVDGLMLLTHCDNIKNSEEQLTENKLWDIPTKFLSRKDASLKLRLEKGRRICRSGEMVRGMNLAGGDHFLPNGFLRFENEYYQPHQFCLNGFKGDELEVKVCRTNCSNPLTPCVQKCCAYDEIYSLGMNGKHGGCLQLESNETQWSPQFYSTLNNKMSVEQMKALRPHIIHKNPSDFKPHCEKKLTTVYPYGKEVLNFLNSALRRELKNLKFQIRKDGLLMHPNGTESKDIAISKDSRTEKYCIDGVQNYGETQQFTNKESQTVLFTCSIPDPAEPVEQLVVSSSVSVSTKISSSSQTPQQKVTISQKSNKETKVSSTMNIPSAKLPTCCHLDPLAAPGAKLSHYCTTNNSSEGNLSSNPQWMAAPKFMNNNKIQSFQLEVQPLKCKDNWTKAFILNYANLPGGGSPSLMPNGMLKFQNEFFRPDGEYCVNGIFSSIVEVLMCKTDCSSPETPCINKCCGPNEIYSLGAKGKKRGCIPLDPGDSAWNPPLYKDMSTPLTPQEMNNIRPHLIQKFPPKFQYSCFKNVTLVFPYDAKVIPLMSPLAKINLQFRIRQDGVVMYRHPIIKDGVTGKLMESVFNNVEYCVDGIRNYGELDEGPYQTMEDQSVLFVCAMNPPQS